MYNAQIKDRETDKVETVEIWVIQTRKWKVTAEVMEDGDYEYDVDALDQNAPDWENIETVYADPSDADDEFEDSESDEDFDAFDAVRRAQSGQTL